MQTDTSDDSQSHIRGFFHGLVEGAAGLFDIFGVRARSGMPEDDAKELLGDVEQIGQDFHAVLRRIESAANR